jgi:hypothetical protein
MKQTKPSILELRSLSPVLGRLSWEPSVDYVTVFDASQKWLDWTAPVIGCAIGAVAVVQYRKRQSPPFDTRFARLLALAGMIWGFGIATVIPYLHWSQRSALVTALREGRTSIVEGPVYDFVPMPWSGHAHECFKVRATTFCYSDFEVTPGFNNARSHGGPIQEGLLVRIHHVNSVIAQLEVAK